MVADSPTTLMVNFAQVLDVEPAPISCMSLSDHSNDEQQHLKHLRLALFRGGNVGVIEIWNVTHQPFLEKCLLDLERIEGKPSVESLIWVKDRLFSCGLHGFVVEHDTCSGKIKSKNAATSGPVWCLAANPDKTLMAAGTEDGFINLFNIDEQSLLYLKVLDRQDGRVLCLHWSQCGRKIATGSVDSVRLWDVEKGHALQRLVTGRTKNKETIVWSVLLLEDLTIVSGDSRGFVSFWDGKIGVLKFKIQTHKADVLSLRLSTDKSNIYAAGVDPVIMMLTKIANSDKWVKSHPRNMHVNDVLCLETHGNRLFSGGVDSELTLSSYPPKVVARYPPFLKGPVVVASAGCKRLLTRQSNSISIWNLPSEDSELKKILDLGSKMQESIYSACLSPSGNTFGYSTLNTLRLFHIDYNPTTSKQPVLSKLKLIDASSEDVTGNYIADETPLQLQFLQEDTMILVSACGKISFLKIDLDSRTANVVKVADIDLSENVGLGVGIVSVAIDGKHLCLSCDGNLSIYSVNNNLDIVKGSSIPSHSAKPTSVSFHPTKTFVLITYADHLVQVFDYKSGRILLYQRVKKKVDDLYPFIGAEWSSDGHSAVLYQVDSLQLLEMEPEEVPKKKTKRTDQNDDKFIFAVKSCAKHKYIAFAGYFNDGNEIVAVDVNPNGLLERLPPSFVKKRFGA